MNNILVLGASGFVGRHLAKALVAAGYSVRCMVRDAGKTAGLAQLGCDIVKGDIGDPAALTHALRGVDAVYIAIHTLSPQPASRAGAGFMEIEMGGVQNIVGACRTHATRRVVYVTSLGVAPDAASAWTRGRWQTEQYLLNSGLDVTVIRPGQIVGAGGQGFDAMAAQAGRRVAIVLGSGQKKSSAISIGDLVYYLLGVLEMPAAYGQIYDVGCDDVLTTDQMIDATARLLGRAAPWKIHLPAGLLRAVAPVIERIARWPKGALAGGLDAMRADLTGDPLPIRAILPNVPLPWRQAVQQALRPAP